VENIGVLRAPWGRPNKTIQLIALFSKAFFCFNPAFESELSTLS
jgi:hypothetical protein